MHGHSPENCSQAGLQGVNRGRTLEVVIVSARTCSPSMVTLASADCHAAAPASAGTSSASRLNLTYDVVDIRWI